MHVQYTYNAAKTELWMHESFNLQKREDQATRVRTFPTCPLAAGGWNRKTWRPRCGGAPGVQLHPIPSEHYWWSLMFFIHFGLLKQPPAGQQKEKEQVFCVQLEHYRSCLKLLEHSIEAMTKMMTYCSQSTPFQGWATPTLAQENKHCQRHNGPGGWVHFAKVTFHLQNLA